jgi:hypothetical protein
MDRSDRDTTAQDAGRPTRRARPSNITTSGVARTPGARSSGLRSSRDAVLDELVDDPETIMRGARSGRRTPAATTNAGAATAGSRQAEQASLPPTIQVDSVPQPAGMSARQPEPPAPLPQTAPQVEAAHVSASPAQPQPQAEPAPSRAHRSTLSPVVEGISDPVPNNGSTTTRQSSPDRMDTDEVRTQPQRPVEPAWDFSQTREIPAPRDESEQRPEHREEDIGNQPAQEPPNQGSVPTREQILLEIKTHLGQVWNGGTLNEASALSDVLNNLVGLLHGRDVHEAFDLQFVAVRLRRASQILGQYLNRQGDAEGTLMKLQWEWNNQDLRDYASQTRLPEPEQWTFPDLEDVAASAASASRPTRESAPSQSERTQFERHTNSSNPSSRATPSPIPVTRHKLTEGQVHLDKKMWAIICWKKQGIGYQLLVRELTPPGTETVVNREFLVRASQFGRSADVMIAYRDNCRHAEAFSSLKYADLKHLILERMTIGGIVMKWDDRNLPFRTEYITQVKIIYDDQGSEHSYYVSRTDFLKHLGGNEGLDAISLYMESHGDRDGVRGLRDHSTGPESPLSAPDNSNGFVRRPLGRSTRREETPSMSTQMAELRIECSNALRQMREQLQMVQEQLRFSRPSRPDQQSEEIPRNI